MLGKNTGTSVRELLSPEEFRYVSEEFLSTIEAFKNTGRLKIEAGAQTNFFTFKTTKANGQYLWFQS